MTMTIEELLVRMYEDIKNIKEELDEIKFALIPEDLPTKKNYRKLDWEIRR
ncbi:MAG: hypothetical protein PVF58_02520 [Candidatus Methanofastidiosia archaeon]|jgi:hypothetical protein